MLRRLSSLRGPSHEKTRHPHAKGRLDRRSNKLIMIGIERPPRVFRFSHQPVEPMRKTPAPPNLPPMEFVWRQVALHPIPQT